MNIKFGMWKQDTEKESPQEVENFVSAVSNNLQKTK